MLGAWVRRGLALAGRRTRGRATPATIRTRWHRVATVRTLSTGRPPLPTSQRFFLTTPLRSFPTKISSRKSMMDAGLVALDVMGFVGPGQRSGPEIHVPSRNGRPRSFRGFGTAGRSSRPPIARKMGASPPEERSPGSSPRAVRPGSLGEGNSGSLGLQRCATDRPTRRSRRPAMFPPGLRRRLASLPSTRDRRQRQARRRPRAGSPRATGYRSQAGDRLTPSATRIR